MSRSDWMRSSASGPRTAEAASSANPPRKTEQAARARRSASWSRSHDQAIAAPQRGLPRLDPAEAAAQQIEPAQKPRQETVEAEHVGARRGQLDRERDPFQPAHEGGDLGQALLADRVARALGVRPVEEELDGIAPLAIAVREAEGAELVGDLAPEPRTLARGDEEADLGRRPHPRVQRRRGRLDHLLEVVEHHQRRALGGEGLPDALDGARVLLPGGDGDAERAGDGAAERLEIAGLLDLAEPHGVVGVRAGPGERELLREARLAHARRAPQRDEALALLEEPGDGFQVRGPADEPRRGHREVLPPPSRRLRDRGGHRRQNRSAAARCHPPPPEARRYGLRTGSTYTVPGAGRPWTSTSIPWAVTVTGVIGVTWR